jgi:predicted transcriptional regulator with HTH domain
MTEEEAVKEVGSILAQLYEEGVSSAKILQDVDGDTYTDLEMNFDDECDRALNRHDNLVQLGLVRLARMNGINADKLNEYVESLTATAAK